MKILVTGAAGFIGFFTVKKLLELGHEVIGLDCINDYYDVRIKYGRLEKSGIPQSKINYGALIGSELYSSYRFIKLRLEDSSELDRVFKNNEIDAVCHLAAQAGVRYSIENPNAYIESNIVGFINVLESCRHNKVSNLSYASSSSVYGLNECMPFSVDHGTNHPVSLYAATKKSNELMAHTYAHLYDMQCTGLRFFTVYGPWGRPDMAPFIFTKAAVNGDGIKVFNNGKMKRDFTYIDDIVEGVVRVIESPCISDSGWNAKQPNPSSSSAAYKIYNIGSSRPVELMTFIEAIEDAVGNEVKKDFQPIQPGDVVATYADVSELEKDFSYRPTTSVVEGVRKMVAWYKHFYRV